MTGRPDAIASSIVLEMPSLSEPKYENIHRRSFSGMSSRLPGSQAASSSQLPSARTAAHAIRHRQSSRALPARPAFYSNECLTRLSGSLIAEKRVTLPMTHIESLCRADSCGRNRSVSTPLQMCCTWRQGMPTTSVSQRCRSSDTVTIRCTKRCRRGASSDTWDWCRPDRRRPSHAHRECGSARGKKCDEAHSPSCPYFACERYPASACATTCIAERTRQGPCPVSFRYCGPRHLGSRSANSGRLGQCDHNVSNWLRRTGH